MSREKNSRMSYELLQNLADQLEDENPRVRLRAVRRLGALADPSAIPALSKVYYNQEETPAVRKAAAEALGVFRAMQEALARTKTSKSRTLLPSKSRAFRRKRSSGCWAS